jgi:hypothetical protein
VVRLVTIAVALAALAIPARALAEPKPVAAGTVRVNVAVGPVRIGLPRSAVVKRIGDPVEQYSDDDWGWDGTRTTFGLVFDHERVARISVAGGGGFCIRARVCTGSRGGVGYLRRKYGARLRFFRAEDGTRAAIIVGKLGKRRVFTIFGDLSSNRSAGRFRSVLLGDCNRGATRPC